MPVEIIDDPENILDISEQMWLMDAAQIDALIDWAYEVIACAEWIREIENERGH